MSFKLHYVLEAHPESVNPAHRTHLLFAMRQLMLGGANAPMNTELFYHQFLNPKQLDAAGAHILTLAKQAWAAPCKDVTCFLDHDLSENAMAALDSIDADPAKNLSLMFMDNLEELVNVAALTESWRSHKENRQHGRGVFKVARNTFEQFVEANPLHEHLPAHFSTYYDKGLHQSKPFQGTVLPRVLLESPFAGDIASNTQYAARCVVDLMLNHHKAPMASHLLYTRVLNDHVPAERQIGIDAGLAYGDHAQESVIAVDRGVSRGMLYGIAHAEQAGRPLTFYTLSTDPIIQQDIKSLRDVADLNAWVNQRRSAQPAELQAKGWLVPPEFPLDAQSFSEAARPELK